MANKETRTRRAALPPIPRDTFEGGRAHGIAEAIRALDTPTEWNQYGLELQAEEVRTIAARLGVPALFVETLYHGGEVEEADEVEEYVAWRLRLAGKAVAP